MNGLFSLLGAGVTVLITLTVLDKEPAPEKLAGDTGKILNETLTDQGKKKKVRGKRKKK